MSGIVKAEPQVDTRRAAGYGGKSPSVFATYVSRREEGGATRVRWHSQIATYEAQTAESSAPSLGR